MIHKRNKAILEGIVNHGRLSHAYIFYGQPGSFVSQSIDYFIHAIQGQALNKSSADCYTLDQKESISVEEIRAIQDYIKFGPISLKYMTVTVKNIQLLTDKAANAFLKTLEEPPPNVIFILSTNQIDQLLPTIKSRCQLFEFPVLTDAEMQSYLTDHYSETERIKIQETCGHNIELMKYYLDEGYTFKESSYIPYMDFIKKDPLARLSFAESIASDKIYIKLLLVCWVKELLQLDFSTENHRHLINIEKIIENISFLKYNLNSRLFLEQLFLPL